MCIYLNLMILIKIIRGFISTQLAFNAAYPVDDINKKIVQPADEHDDR